MGVEHLISNDGDPIIVWRILASFSVQFFVLEADASDIIFVGEPMRFHWRRCPDQLFVT